jgi:hypothetical protein
VPQKKKKIIFIFSKDTPQVSISFKFPADTHQLSWEVIKKTILGIFNNRMRAPMGISLSEIGTGVPFFQSALQIFTPLNMACKYTRILCPVLYI